MRIGVESRGLSAVGGMQVYLRNLLQRLPQLDPGNHYVIYYDTADSALHLSAPNVTERVLTLSGRAPRVAFDQYLLPRQLRADGVDLALFTKAPGALIKSCPWALIVRDLIPLIYPKTMAWADSLYWRVMLPRAIRRAERVIAISESVRQDILARIPGVPPDKVHVTPLAFGPGFSPSDGAADADVRGRLGLPERYILYVGALEPRKNLPTLIEAFGRLRASGHADLKLVLAGKRGHYDRRLDETIARLGLAADVILTGTVPDADLPALYRLATVFCYPSLYEGFGIPLLEAMASGTPVVASNVSSLPEVLGDAGLLFAPHDIAQLAAQLDRVLLDDALRHGLVARGLDRAGGYTWDATALKTVDVLHTLQGAA